MIATIREIYHELGPNRFWAELITGPALLASGFVTITLWVEVLS